MIAGLLAGLAVVALLARPRARLPRAAPARSSDLKVPGACAVAGVALWLLVGGPLGLALGAGAAVAGPRLIARLDGAESEGAELTLSLIHISEPTRPY